MWMWWSRKNTKKILDSICDCNDGKNFYIHYRMSKFDARRGITVDKVHEIITFIQSKCLEKYTNPISKEEI